MSQTAVIEQGDARIGLLADTGIHDILSFSGEVAIPFGRWVRRGTNAVEQCNLPSAATHITDLKLGLGVTIAQHTLEVPRRSTADPTYTKDFTVSILTLSLIHISEPTRLRRSRMPSSA